MSFIGPSGVRHHGSGHGTRPGVRRQGPWRRAGAKKRLPGLGPALARTAARSIVPAARTGPFFNDGAPPEGWPSGLRRTLGKRVYGKP